MKNMKKIFSFSLALSTMLTFNLVSLTKNSTCLAVLQDLEKLDVKSMISQFLLPYEINSENGGKNLVKNFSGMTKRINTRNCELFFEMVSRILEYLFNLVKSGKISKNIILDKINSGGFNFTHKTLSNIETAMNCIKGELNAGDTVLKSQSLIYVLNPFVLKFLFKNAPLPKKEETPQKNLPLLKKEETPFTINSNIDAREMINESLSKYKKSVEMYNPESIEIARVRDIYCFMRGLSELGSIKESDITNTLLFSKMISIKIKYFFFLVLNYMYSETEVLYTQ